MIKLNIGCGRDYRPGWVNIDISPQVKAEKYLDIRRESLPYADDSASEIYISGVLEQIESNDHFVHVMVECYRVLAKNGRMTVVVPNARYAIASQDPMDVRKFTKETFNYFLRGDRHHKLYGSVYGFPGFDMITINENERHIFTAELIMQVPAGREKPKVPGYDYLNDSL